MFSQYIIYWKKMVINTIRGSIKAWGIETLVALNLVFPIFYHASSSFSWWLTYTISFLQWLHVMLILLDNVNINKFQTYFQFLHAVFCFLLINSLFYFFQKLVSCFIYFLVYTHGLRLILSYLFLKYLYIILSIFYSY